MSSMRERMPATAGLVDALRDAFGQASVDAQIRAGLNGAPTFWAQENGHELGTLATIERSANTHTFTEAELQEKVWRRTP